jgi:hypothetical protein
MEVNHVRQRNILSDLFLKESYTVKNFKDYLIIDIYNKRT